MAYPLFKRLSEKSVWERIFVERLSEPLHLNFLSIFVGLFGGVESKIFWDLKVRQNYAFGMLAAARQAREAGLKSVTVAEFGVSRGSGLFNMIDLSVEITKATGVEFQIVGFDTGTGMPPPIDYRDHPDSYTEGDFPMIDPEALRKKLPSNARIILGPVKETAPAFAKELTPDSPLGFASVDVDYYSSTLEALQVFEGPAECYFRLIDVYFDDVEGQPHNPWCGQYLAINEFNDAHKMRKIAPHNLLRGKRLFKNARWIDKMFTLHVLDHPRRSVMKPREKPQVLDNPYLR